MGSLQAVRERTVPCFQDMDWPWIHSPDIKDEEFLLLQAALHNSVRVSLPTACEGNPAQGALAQQLPPIPPQGQRGQ